MRNKSFHHYSTVIFLSCILACTAKDIPGCDFLDTVDLSGSVKYANGSYLYEEVLIPPELIGEYDHDENNVNVPKHTRGCVCQLKSCVRLCCHPQAHIVPNSLQCSPELQEELRLDPYVDVTFSNGSSIRTHILNEFVAQRGMPCLEVYPLHADLLEEDRWELFENGTLFREYDSAYLSKSKYCLHPVANESGHAVFKPHNCIIYVETSFTDNLNLNLVAASIIFMILTIFVHLYLKKLRNLLGKCLICYLTSLVVAYFMLNITSRLSDLPYLWCESVGYIGYFAFMSAFLWSSVISFDIWSTFAGKRLNFNDNFIVYILYAFGTAVLCTFIIFLIDFTEIINNDWIPGVGLYTCWINTATWSAMLYLYGPMLFLMGFNITMFILSARRIIEIRMRLELNEMTDEQVQRLSTKKRTYKMFLRLFFIMGIVWFFEVFSYTLSSIEWLQPAIFCMDLIVASHGIIIFILLVLRRKVFRLISEKFRGNNTTPDSQENSEEGFSLQGNTYAMSILN